MVYRDSFILIFLLFIIALLPSCDGNEGPCPSCLDITVKNVQYVDAEGKNLLFGNEAIFNPEDVVITDGIGEPVFFYVNEEEESISFDLFNMTDAYEVRLTSSRSDKIVFELSERKSQYCCGNVVISTKTILNDQEVSNENQIVIEITP